MTFLGWWVHVTLQRGWKGLNHMVAGCFLNIPLGVPASNRTTNTTHWVVIFPWWSLQVISIGKVPGKYPHLHYSARPVSFNYIFEKPSDATSAGESTNPRSTPKGQTYCRLLPNMGHVQHFQGPEMNGERNLPKSTPNNPLTEFKENHRWICLKTMNEDNEDAFLVESMRIFLVVIWLVFRGGKRPGSSKLPILHPSHRIP